MTTLSKSQSDNTRASLVLRAKSRDSQAWSDLVDLYGPLIAHWCGRCGLKSDQIPDSVQDVFKSVATSIDRFEPRKASGAFRGWLWTITSNRVKDVYRHNALQPEAEGGSTALARLNQVIEPVELDEEPTDAEQMGELVARGLQQVQSEFEPRTWDIFRRCVLDQIATPIVAQEFCVTPAAVRQVRSRVLRRLRQQLGDLQ